MGMVEVIEDRWFTGTTDRLIPCDFTDVEKASFMEILGFASDPANQDLELMHCIDGAGTRRVDRSTGRNGAPMTDAMKVAAAKGPVRLWHNHSSQDSISHHDWHAASASPTIEILALNLSGSTFAGRVPDRSPDLETVIAAFSDISAMLEVRMSTFATSAGLDIDDIVAFARRTGHVMNLAMAQCRLVDYSYCLFGADEANMALATTAGVVTTGVAFAVGEIVRLTGTAGKTLSRAPGASPSV